MYYILNVLNVLKRLVYDIIEVRKDSIMKQMETTLLLLRKENKILLAMKKRGFGAGKYNGVGGKLEKSETPEEAMIREAKEEINIIPTVFEKMGVVEFIEFGR